MTKVKRPPSTGEQTAIRGYLRQYEYAAATLYRLMQDGLLESLYLCPPEAGIFDDLVVFSNSRIQAVQVKSEHNATYVSLKTEFKAGLLRSMLEAWANLKTTFGRPVDLKYIFPGLFNTQDTALADNGTSGARHSAEFARFVSRGDLNPKVVQSSIWSSTIGEWQKDSTLSEGEFYEFITGLSLEDERALVATHTDTFQPGDREKVDEIRNLLPALVADVTPGTMWTEQDLVSKLGWQSRLSQRNTHVFPVPSDYQENTTTEFLLQKLKALESGYVALVGPPGTGKSTLLQREIFSTNEFRVARYLAFHPDKRHGLGRAEAVDFFNDLIADLYSQGISGSRYRSDSLSGLRQEFMRQLSVANSEFNEKGRKTVIVIDGLDHVFREETPQVSFLGELPAASAIPEGVLIVFGTQWVDLPSVHPTIVQQLSQENRTVEIEPLTKKAVAELAEASGLPSYVERSRLFSSCDGHPLSARYFVEALRNVSNADEANAILGADGLGRNLEEIYERVWQKIEQRDECKGVLALLARTEASLSCEQLASVTNDETVEVVLKHAAFLLKRTESNRLSIFHNSFRLFASHATATRFGQFDAEAEIAFQSQLASIAQSVPPDDPQFWLRLRYLSRAGDHAGVVELGEPSYFRESLQVLRPAEEIYSDLRFVYGAVRQLKDRVALLRTLLIEKEVSYRLEALSELDFVQLILKLDEPDRALQHALTTNDTGDGWIDLVDHYWETGQREIARQLFEANEPLELFYGEDGFDPNQEMDLAERWIERAHRFRSVEKLLDLVDGLIERPTTHGMPDQNNDTSWDTDEDTSWVSGRLKFHLGVGLIDDGYPDDISTLQSKLGLGAEEAGTLAVHAAESSFSQGETQIAKTYLDFAKSNGSLEKAHASWRRAAAKLAVALGDLKYARELAKTLTVPRLDREAVSNDMMQLAGAIIDTDHLATSLGLEIPEEPKRDRYEPSELLAQAHEKLRQLGKLRGKASRQAAGITSRELKTVLLFFASAKPERGDFDGHKYFASLPAIAKQILKVATDAGENCFADIVSSIDEIVARNDNNFSGSDSFRLAFARSVFSLNSEADHAVERIGAVESEEKYFHTPHEAAESFAAIASAYCAVNRPDLARECLGVMHNETFGYWLAAKKEPQYEFWKWIYSQACEELQSDMEQGALTFAQFLLGMEETEGKNTAYRVYQCLLEGSSISPPAAAGIAARFYDSDIGTWAGITEASLTAVVKADVTLAPLVVVASAQLIVPFSDNGVERLLSIALPSMSEQARAHPIALLVQSLERWCPSSKRELLFETIIEHAPETRPSIEANLSDATQMAQELRRISHGEPRTHEGSQDYSGDINVGSLAELIEHSDGKSSYGDRVDYSYAKTAEKLIPMASETEILNLLSERPHLEESAKCMAAVSQHFLKNGKRAKAEEFLIKAEGSAMSGHWTNFMGGEKLAVQKLRAALYPNSAVDQGFDNLTSELERGTTDASLLFMNLKEVLELLADPIPVADFWSETQKHFEQFREFKLAKPVAPSPSVITPLDLLANIVVQGFKLSCPQVIVHARQAAVDVASITSDTGFVEKLVELLRELPDGAREAAALVNQLSDVPQLSESLVHFALQGLEEQDLVVSRLSERTLRELGKSIAVNPAVDLPTYYQIQGIGGGQPSNFDPPPGLLSDGRAVWSEDPWTWTSMLRFPLSIAKDASGIPMEVLRRRCAYFMQQEGGREAFGPEVEEGQRAKLRSLTLPFPNRRPMASAALRAIGKLLSELDKANAIAPSAFPVIWEEIGGPNVQNSMPGESPKPDWLEWPDFPLKQYGGVDIESWLCDAGKHLSSVYLPGGRLIAEKMHFALHSSRATTSIDKLVLPKAADINGGSNSLPRVFSLDDLRPMYDESESKGVCRVPGNLYGDFQEELLIFCPYLSRRLGWVSRDDEPFSLFDRQGNAVCESVRWVQGTYEYQPTYESEMFGKGQFVYLTGVGIAQLIAAGMDLSTNVTVTKSAVEESKAAETRDFIARY